MPVKGIKQVQQRTTALLTKIAGPITEKVMYEVMITGGAYSDAITPRDTSTLVNSRYIKINPISKGFVGKIGYAANYSQYVNDASGKLVHTQRPDGNGYYWDPAGEPDFLRKGFERDGLEDIKATIERGYKI